MTCLRQLLAKSRHRTRARAARQRPRQELGWTCPAATRARAARVTRHPKAAPAPAHLKGHHLVQRALHAQLQPTRATLYQRSRSTRTQLRQALILQIRERLLAASQRAQAAATGVVVLQRPLRSSQAKRVALARRAVSLHRMRTLQLRVPVLCGTRSRAAAVTSVRAASSA